MKRKGIKRRKGEVKGKEDERKENKRGGTIERG